MIELSTPDGTLKWKLGKKLMGDTAALNAYRQPRQGTFDGLTSERAHKSKAGFLALAAAVWPNFKLVRDTD